MTRSQVRSAILASTVVPCAAVLLLLTGCTNTQSAANREPHTGTTTAVEIGGVQQVRINVDQSFRFSPSTITVHPGKVMITLAHSATGAPHNWQLLGFPGDYVPTVNPGRTSSVTFVAPSPGKYTFECTIHVRQGQTGTLIVSAG